MIFTDASPEDLALITAALGREPAGRCRVVVRRANRAPVVIENEPHLRDGTPMPTLYWLIDPEIHDAVSRIESDGGVHRFEDIVDPERLSATHDAYAALRTSRTERHDVPAPSGGVGGTRTGVKCLHAHVANYLVDGRDPVGAEVVTLLTLPSLIVEA